MSSSINIFNQAINKIFNIYISRDDWNTVLKLSCLLGKVEYLKLAIKHKASRSKIQKHSFRHSSTPFEIPDFPIKSKAIDFEHGLQIACKEGHLEIVKMLCGCGTEIELLFSMLEKSSSSLARKWSYALSCAIEGGHDDVIDFMQSLVDNRSCEHAKFECESGHYQLVNHMVELSHQLVN